MMFRKNRKPRLLDRGCENLDENSDSNRKVFPDASRHLQVFRRGSAAIGDKLILYILTLVERAQPGALDSGDVDEHVLVA